MNYDTPFGPSPLHGAAHAAGRRRGGLQQGQLHRIIITIALLETLMGVAVGAAPALRLETRALRAGDRLLCEQRCS